jgi:hypothetical protein
MEYGMCRVTSGERAVRVGALQAETDGKEEVARGRAAIVEDPKSFARGFFPEAVHKSPAATSESRRG